MRRQVIDATHYGSLFQKLENTSSREAAVPIDDVGAGSAFP
jgi:hypothetical protein